MRIYVGFDARDVGVPHDAVYDSSSRGRRDLTDRPLQATPSGVFLLLGNLPSRLPTYPLGARLLEDLVENGAFEAKDAPTEIFYLLFRLGERLDFGERDTL